MLKSSSVKTRFAKSRGRPTKDEADLSLRGAHEARQATALARPQAPRCPPVSVHRLRACRHDRVARIRRRGALNELRDSLGAGANSRARTKDAPGQSLKATGRSGYSNSELMSGGASDARALANISACSRCLRVRIFPCQNSPRDPETTMKPASGLAHAASIPVPND